MTNKFILFIFFAVLSVNCSNEFELTEDWKDIPIVYGLLNQADTAHYIRIEKAFLDESTSALTIAQIPDSIFYDNISVELQESPVGGTGVGAVYRLDRVDANEEGYVKEEGVFANSPNYVYKTTASLKENALYRLVINNDDNDKTITASTRIAEDFELFTPIEGPPLRLQPGNNLTFQWLTTPSGKFFDIILRIRYTEANQGTPNDKTLKSIDWQVANTVKPGTGSNLMLVRVETDELYPFLAASLKEDPSLVREVTTVDIIINAGGEDLLKYIEVGLANSGITGSETLPVYTNMSEGLGIFSTRFTKIIPNFTISEVAKDSLKAGQYTSDLGFQ